MSCCCISVPLIFNIDDSAPGLPPFSNAESNLSSVISKAESDISNSLTFFFKSSLSRSATISLRRFNCLIDAPTEAIPNLSCANKNLA